MRGMDALKIFAESSLLRSVSKEKLDDDITNGRRRSMKNIFGRGVSEY